MSQRNTVGAREYGRKDNSGNPEHDREAIGKELKRIGDEIKTMAEAAQKEIKRAGEMSAETKAATDKLLTQQGELAARLQEVEQKLAESRSSGRDEKPELIGSIVRKAIEADDKVKGLLARPVVKQAVSFDVPRSALAKALTSTSGGGDLLYPADVLPLVSPLVRRLTIRNLIMPGRTSASAIFYPRESGFTNGAAIQSSEGATKGEAEIEFEDITQPVVTIAHFTVVSTQMLADVAYLESYLNGRMMYGLSLKEEDQMLNGSGVGQNLEGLFTIATAYSEPAGVNVSDETFLDRLRLMLLQVELADAMATGIVLNPVDWANIELLKDSQNRYLFAAPQGIATPRLWGRDVIPTKSMGADDALVGDFAAHSQVLDREDASVAISFEDSDNFRRNLATIRVEERLALANYRPEAFVKGSLSSS